MKMNFKLALRILLKLLAFLKKKLFVVF